jgi:glutamate-1-semialdehyde 2,1-aminomutase
MANTSQQAGVIFILDEVMTSRVAPGGLASIYGLNPDLKSFGKYLGGGLAFGAFGGRADVMAVYDPRPGSKATPTLQHHGTFNNNSLAMYAGHAGLSKIYPPEVCTEFNEVGNRLLDRLAEVTKGTKMCFSGIGTVFASHFTEAGLQTIEREGPEDWTLKELFWYEMMEDGFWITRRGSIALVLGTPQEELDRFVDRVSAFLDRHESLVRIP